jgi:hypothetical protein
LSAVRATGQVCCNTIFCCSRFKKMNAPAFSWDPNRSSISDCFLFVVRTAGNSTHFVKLVGKVFRVKLLIIK